MATRIFKLLTTLATALVAGCKLTVISPPGGLVNSLNGIYCVGGTVCEVTIDDVSYTDTFFAYPKAGYEFVKWQKGEGFLCRDAGRDCIVEMPDDANQAAAIIGLFATAYIMPVYKDVGADTDLDGDRNEIDLDDDNDGLPDADDSCPLNPTIPCALITGNDIVTADGTQWAQPALFNNLSWSQINEVCPAASNGICINGGVLSGRDMTGWIWATLSEVAPLFNSYGVSPPFTTTGQQTRRGLASSWAPAIFVDGFNPSFTYPGVQCFAGSPVGSAERVSGYTRDSESYAGMVEAIGVAYVQDFEALACEDTAVTFLKTASPTFADPEMAGGWFYFQLPFTPEGGI